MIIILILFCVALVIGGLWGRWQARSHRFSFAVLLTAPVASAALMAVVVAMMFMLGDPPAHILARPLFDRITTYVSIGCLYGGWVGGLIGAIPALVGSGGTQLLILWASARPANTRRGSGDTQAIPDEPDAAADRPRD